MQEYFQARQADTSIDHKGKGRATLGQIAYDIAAASAFSQETPSSPSTSTLQQSPSEVDNRPKIMVIGDRVMTDVVLANRMNKKRWRQAASAFQAVPILTTRLWQSEGLGTRFMRVMETFAMRRASSYYRRRKVDAEIEWHDCVIHPASPVPASIPLRTPRAARRPIYQYFSRQHLRHTLSQAAYGILAVIRRLLLPVTRRLEPILNEARQAQFGFRIPEGYKRTKLLREVLEGREAISTRK